MNSNAILIAIGVVAGGALLVVLSMWSRAQALDALRRWAAAEGLELVSATRRSFVPLWCSGKGYQFFRVTVRDRDGANHSAWMRMESDCTEPEVLDVIWDDKRPRA